MDDCLVREYAFKIIGTANCSCACNNHIQEVLDRLVMRLPATKYHFLNHLLFGNCRIFYGDAEVEGSSTLKSESKSREVIGVIRVIIQSAHISERVVLWSVRPSISTRIRINQQQVGSTGRQIRTRDPNWFSETHYGLVYSLDDVLNLDVIDYGLFDWPVLIGSAVTTLSKTERGFFHTNRKLTLGKRQKQRGNLLCDLFFYPIRGNEIQHKIEDRGQQGVVRIRFERAKGLKSATGKINLKSIAELSFGWNDSPIHVTPPGQSENPSWNSVHEFMCINKSSTLVIVKVVDARHKQQVLGHISLPLEDLLQGEESCNRWWSMSGCIGGQLKMDVQWKALEIR
ncbi:hypothetical protein BDQ12DRAFT_711072, partial [Crucibulum laeve]